MLAKRSVAMIVRQLMVPETHLIPNAGLRLFSARPTHWRLPNRPVEGSKANFWGPLLICTGTSGGIFTAFALLDFKRRKEVRRVGARRHSVPAWVPDILQPIYLQARQRWNSLPETKRVLYSIIAANVGVSLLWRIPSLQGFMFRNFVLQLPPQRTRPWTFLTSNFSHAGTLHLAVNMLALSSFGSVVAEDCDAYQFAAFYLSAGLASSMTTYLARLGRRGRGGSSLGASGAVYACFAAAALMHPDAHGAFIFLPGIPIRLGDLLPALMCLDAVGVFMGWRYLDHWGHLGGALFGILYTKYGHRVWDKRDDFLTKTGLAKLVV